MPSKASACYLRIILLLAASAAPLVHAFVAPPIQQRLSRLSFSSSSAYLESLSANAKTPVNNVGLKQDNSVSNVANTPPPSSPPPPPSKISIDRFDSIGSFLTAIDTAPQDSLVVIKYYSTSCPLCKRVALKYKKLARFYSTAPIRFAEMPKNAETATLFDTLKDDITTFPFLQIYRNGQCIASHGTQTASMFERIVNDSIYRFLTMPPDQWPQFLTAYQNNIQKVTDKINQLRD